jgi:hypothetical protein
MKQQLTKAMIRILDGEPEVSEFEVLFNPADYSVEYSSSYAETAPPGLNNPILQFVNGNAQVLTMELLFDTYTDGGGFDVSERTRRFTDMLSIDGDVHAPSRVEFSWGVFSFVAIVEKISQRFTMFLADGTPVRANLSVTFKQYKTIAEQLKDPPRRSADKTKRRVFESHDSLWLLAAREYGDPRFWRHIARANRIDEPRTIEPGTVLVLPPAESFREVSGAT